MVEKKICKYCFARGVVTVITRKTYITKSGRKVQESAKLWNKREHCDKHMAQARRDGQLKRPDRVSKKNYANASEMMVMFKTGKHYTILDQWLTGEIGHRPRNKFKLRLVA